MKNKKYILILVLLIIVLIIGRAYLLKSKGQDDIVETPMVLNGKSGFQGPMTFMGLYIEKLNPESKNAVAEAILGTKEGEPINRDIIIAEFEMTSGSTLYEYEPVLPYSGDTTWYITLNTDDNTLESTRVNRILDSLAEAEVERDELIANLEQNYHRVFENESHIYLKNRYGDLMMIHIRPYKDKYELRLDGIFVERKK